MKKECPITKEELYNLYWVQNNSLIKIGNLYNVSVNIITRWIKEYNIPIKTYSEASKGKIYIVNPTTKEKLNNLYWLQNKSTKEISIIFNCSQRTIIKWLNEYNISIKTKTQTHTKKIPNKKDLFDLYCVYNKSSKEIGEKYKVCPETVLKWLKGYGIKIKPPSNYKGKYSGEKSFQWKGGLSYGEYCYKFNKSCKEKSRNKFNNKCFLCGIHEEKCKRNLHIHHVDYNKNQGCNTTSWQLVPLCPSCHMKTNHNREYWENLLTILLNVRKLIIEYNGKIDYKSINI